MFLEAATHKKNISRTFSFKSSRSLISFQKQSRSLKNIEIHLGAATHLLKHKNIFRSSYTNLHGFCTKYTHFV